jgi:hypothetical protein
MKKRSGIRMGVVANVGFAQADYLCRLVKQLDKSIPNPFHGDSHNACKLEKLGRFKPEQEGKAVRVRLRLPTLTNLPL